MIVTWQVNIDYPQNHYLLHNEVVIYNSLSGQTHLFVLLAHDIFSIAGKSQISAAEISRRLSKSTGLDDNSELLKYVEDFMQELVKLDFAVRYV